MECLGDTDSRSVVRGDLHHQITVVGGRLGLLAIPYACSHPLHLIDLILHDRGREHAIRHHRKLLKQTFLQVLRTDHTLLHLETALNETLEHLRVRELLQHVIQRTLHVLGEVGQIVHLVEDKLAFRFLFRTLREELVIAAKHGHEEGQEGVEQTGLLEDGTADSDLLGITRINETPFPYFNARTKKSTGSTP